MSASELSDDTLTLYYYKDGLTAAERQQVANTLAIDAGLAVRYQRLSEELGQIALHPTVSVRSDITERWHDTIKQAARREARQHSKPKLHSWSFVWGATVTAALAVGIGIGFMLSDEGTELPQQSDETVVANQPGSAFVRGLQVHLRDSEAGLARFGNASAADKTVLIMNIIQQNRRFEKAAIHNDDQSVARVLRAFERVLIEIAAEETAPEDAEKLRAKLLFEFNIMLTKLSRDASDEPQTI